MYDRVAKGVAAKIADGEFAVGERLPSERELALAYGGDLQLVETGPEGSVFEIVLPGGAAPPAKPRRKAA